MNAAINSSIPGAISGAAGLRNAAVPVFAGGPVPALPAGGTGMMMPEVRGQRDGPGVAASAARGPAAASGRLGEQAVRVLGDQFARALDRRSQEGDAPPALPTDAAPAAAWPGLLPAALPSTPAAPAPAAAAPSRTAAPAIDAAAALSDAPLTGLVPVEAGGAWELSLNEPHGLQLSLRAERVAAATGAVGAPAAWSLAISATGAEAAALQRHAPRLAERLAARALAPAHLRIAADDDTRGD